MNFLRTKHDFSMRWKSAKIVPQIQHLKSYDYVSGVKTHFNHCSSVSIVKVGLSPSKKNIYFDDSPLKMMENSFYLILKALFVLKIFKHLSWIFGHVKKPSSIRKIRLVSKFMTLHPGKQRITIHILLNISQIKGNQTMKFGQLIEYPKIHIFL